MRLTAMNTDRGSRTHTFEKAVENGKVYRIRDRALNIPDKLVETTQEELVTKMLEISHQGQGEDKPMDHDEEARKKQGENRSMVCSDGKHSNF